MRWDSLLIDSSIIFYLLIEVGGFHQEAEQTAPVAGWHLAFRSMLLLSFPTPPPIPGSLHHRISVRNSNAPKPLHHVGELLFFLEWPKTSSRTSRLILAPKCPGHHDNVLLFVAVVGALKVAPRAGLNTREVPVSPAGCSCGGSWVTLPF